MPLDLEKRKRYMRRYAKIYNRKHKSRVRKHQERFRQNSPDKLRNNYYKCKYGISLTDYKTLRKNQNGTCAICKQKDPFKKWLSIDHIHGTRQIRGLLCHRCNVALGLFRDNIKVIKRAVFYLQGESVC